MELACSRDMPEHLGISELCLRTWPARADTNEGKREGSVRRALLPELGREEALRNGVGINAYPARWGDRS